MCDPTCRAGFEPLELDLMLQGWNAASGGGLETLAMDLSPRAVEPSHKSVEPSLESVKPSPGSVKPSSENVGPRIKVWRTAPKA